MITEHELNKLFASLGIPTNGREMVRQIRSANPSRRVVAGAGNVATRYPSRKMGWIVQAESHTGELPAVYIWDHDTVTHEFYDQAPRIKLNYTDRNGKNRGHTTRPDFFLIQDDFIGWVECKDEKWLQARKAENSPLFVQEADGSWSCPAGIAFARKLGLGFKVRSSLENPPALDRNLEFLTDYWDMPAPLQRYEESLAKLKSLFEKKAWYCLADLLGPDHMLDADAVNWAITHEHVFVDLLTQPLAETHNVTVFRSEVHAKAFHLQADSVQRPNQRIDLSSLPIDMRPGAKIAWDDALFTIKTVTPITAYLEDTTGNLVTLTNDQLLELAKRGAIKGALSAREKVCSHADEIIFSAAPSDLDDGMARHDLLKRMACTSGATAITVTDRTIRNWRRRARDGEEIYGNAFVGLISKTSSRGNRNRKMDEAVISKMTEIINADYASCGATLSKTLCYGKLLNACEAENLVAPSEKTFRKTVKSLISIEKETHSRQGERAAYKHSPFIYTLHYSTPRHGDRPFEFGHIDHTQLDLQLVGRKWGESLGKAWLTLMLDATTRSVLAFVITFDPPSYRSCMLVIRDCIKRHGRLPSTIVVDQGSDFESTYFETLLARFSVAKKSRPRQKPRFGANAVQLR